MNEDIDLTPPLEFRLFVPCKKECHEECVRILDDAQCSCPCHTRKKGEYYEDDELDQVAEGLEEESGAEEGSTDVDAEAE